MPVNPYTDIRNTGQVGLSRIRSCCTAGCPEETYDVPLRKDTRYVVINSKTLRTIFNGVCDYCSISNGITTCPNGMYASGNAVLDEVSHHF
jgi:hypothetical protein